MSESLSPQLKADIEVLDIAIPVLRDYLMDKEEVNHLIEGEEYSDAQLQMYLMMSLDAYNSIPPLTLRATISQFPSITLLLEGAAIYALKSSIFKFARNAFQYNDSGVQVSVEEKAGEYERTVQRMMNEWIVNAKSIKESVNLESCYGSFASEYWNLYIVGRRTRKT